MTRKIVQRKLGSNTRSTAAEDWQRCRNVVNFWKQKPRNYWFELLEHNNVNRSIKEERLSLQEAVDESWIIIRISSRQLFFPREQRSATLIHQWRKFQIRVEVYKCNWANVQKINSAFCVFVLWKNGLIATLCIRSVSVREQVSLRPGMFFDLQTSRD